MISDNKSRGKGTYGIDHNPGFDFLRLANNLSEIDATNSHLPFAPYYIPVIALLSGCCSIEAYVNMVGFKTDADWEAFDKGHVTIKERIKHIHEKLDIKPDFSQGVLQETLNLFKMRNSLVHPRYNKKEEQREEHIPDLFDDLDQEYPAIKSQKIAKDTIDYLLSISKLEKLKDHWRSSSYAGHGK